MFEVEDAVGGPCKALINGVLAALKKAVVKATATVVTTKNNRLYSSQL